jgi:hypothetical protein
MLLMPHRLKILVVLALVALMPLRALASVTTGFCANGHQEQPVAAHGAHGDHGEHAHHGAEDQPAKPVTPTSAPSTARAPPLRLMERPKSWRRPPSRKQAPVLPRTPRRLSSPTSSTDLRSPSFATG